MANTFLTKEVIKATFDATGGKAIAAHKLGVVIPAGAIIVNSYYNVRTTFTSATDAGTIALSTGEGAGDLKAAIAISAAGDVYDAGLHGNLPGSYAEATVAGDTAILDAARKAASFILTTANRELIATVAVEALTAGVLDVYIEYVI
jgi:hypothetical protein